VSLLFGALLALDLSALSLLFALTYIPGLLFLSVLLLQAGPYWAPAGALRCERSLSLGLGVGCCLFIGSIGGGCSLSMGGLGVSSALVEDFFLAEGGLFVQATTLLYLMFYVLYLLETLSLNLLLCLGLAAALLLLRLAAARRPQPTLGGLLPRFRVSSAGGYAGLRTAQRLRRANRRAASGWVRGS
jgi:hypothetical protein